jgi:hypothetical protein
MRFIDRQSAETGSIWHLAPGGGSGVREPSGAPGPDAAVRARSRSVENQFATAMISRDAVASRHDRTRIVVVPAGKPARRGSLLMLLLAVLGAAEIGVSQSAAEVCGKLAEFPCGP